MLNMDPPLHTRYRRLVNKGFTPRMVTQLHDRIHAATDGIIDSVIEEGSADFVTDIAAELPLIVIADLLGCSRRRPAPHVRLVQPDDRQRGPRVSNQTAGEVAQQASMELYAYASELFASEAGRSP